MPSSVEETQPIAADIAILGVGAIGQLLGHQLHASGAQLLLLTRRESGQHPLTLTEAVSQLNTQSQAQLRSRTMSANTLAYTELTRERLAGIRLLIVTTKAYQVLDLVLPMLDKLSSDCHILLLHNGMGPHITLSVKLKAYPHLGLSLGTISQGAMRVSQWHVQHTGTGLTQLGHGFGVAMPKAYRQRLLYAIPDCQWQDDIITSLWHKLAINCAINPLTAIHQCHNGALSAEHHQHTIHLLLRELIPVAKAQGVVLNFDMLIEKVNQVISLTAKNHSSMYQDIVHRRLTEIDQINGFVVQCAKTYSLDTPVNSRLVAAIKALEVGPH